MTVSPRTRDSARLAALAVGVLVLVVLLLGARQSVMSIDEGIWNHVARAWVEDGVPPYQGPIENKTPGIYYLFALSYLLVGPGYGLPRLLGIAALLGCCAALHALTRRLCDRTAALTAALVAGLAMASRAVQGPEASMTESFMVAFVTLGLLLVVTAAPLASSGRWRRFLAAGAALGLGIAFKQVALTSAGALAAFAWAATPADRRTLRTWTGDLAVIACGILLATAATMIPLWLAGVSAAEYWRGAWLILLDPGSSVHTLGGRVAQFQRRFRDPITTLTIVFGIFLLCRRPLVARGVPWGALVAWCGVDWVGVLASGWFFPHQFKQVIPALSACAGIVASLAAGQAWRWNVEPSRSLLVVLVVAALVVLPQAAILDAPFGRRVSDVEANAVRVGEWVRDRTSPDDLVFGWVRGGSVQTISGRRSPTRYFNANFVTSEAALAEVQADLARRPPRIVVVEESTPDWLAAELRARYDLVLRDRRFSVFERRRGGP